MRTSLSARRLDAPVSHLLRGALQDLLCLWWRA
jgi:hypothetical protein